MATVERTGSFKQLTALRDAELTNESTLNVRRYRDLDLFFTKRSRNKDVNILVDVAAIKRSVRNLVLYNFYEKPFHPEVGSGVRGLLFENANPLTSIAIAQSIEDVLAINEPRAETISVDVLPQLDSNSYLVTVNFSVVNAPAELVQLDVLLEVTR